MSHQKMKPVSFCFVHEGPENSTRVVSIGFPVIKHTTHTQGTNTHAIKYM